MSLLSIRLFGRPRASYDGAAEVKLGHTGQTLLAYLLLHRDFTSRDVLASLCWAEQPEDSARSCLNTALWRLRAALEPDSTARGTVLLTTPAGEVGFNWQGEHWLDLAEFEAAAAAALACPPSALAGSQAAALEQSLTLYTSDLLEGFYDDWALRERERLRNLYLDAHHHLMRYYGLHQAHELGIAAGQRILRLDPLREDVHRELIRLYARNGQRAHAVRQYMTCREVLAVELGIPPMEDTEACYRAVLADGEAPIAPSLPASVGLGRASRRAPAAPSDPLAVALVELAAARRQLLAAQSDLRRAVALVESLAYPSQSAGIGMQPIV